VTSSWSFILQLTYMLFKICLMSRTITFQS